MEAGRRQSAADAALHEPGDSRRRRARRAVYLERYRQVLETFDAYLRAPPTRADEPLIAYFCAEYGFHESFPIYSGGLGILAGDHCKAASDERLNFVAVGLLYTQGYFIQSVDNDGVQRAQYREHDPRDLPVEAVREPTATGSGERAHRRPRGRGAHLEGPGRPRVGLSARHQLSGERPRGSRDHAPALRRR